MLTVFLRLIGETLNHFHSVNFACKFGQYGCLIARTRSYFQHFMGWLKIEQFGHLCHNIRLRNSLTAIGEERMIGICQMTYFERNKKMCKQESKIQ